MDMSSIISSILTLPEVERIDSLASLAARIYNSMVSPREVEGFTVGELMSLMRIVDVHEIAYKQQQMERAMALVRMARPKAVDVDFI
jgi:hypothetical protein